MKKIFVAFCIILLLISFDFYEMTFFNGTKVNYNDLVTEEALPPFIELTDMSVSDSSSSSSTSKPVTAAPARTLNL